MLVESTHLAVTDDDAFFRYVSWILGFVYSNCFFIGMVIQAVANYNKKSTVGYSTDFSVIAFSGYIMLVFNQTIGMVDPYSDAGRVHIMDEYSACAMFVASAVQYT